MEAVNASGTLRADMRIDDLLALNDPRWANLTHAYGSAADIPALLHSLACGAEPTTSPENEPWFSIWSSLCHQGDVFDASYAAVPHIVAIGCVEAFPISFNFFQFPAAVEIARATGRGPGVPDHLREAYFVAIKQIEECITRHLMHDWDQDTLLSALAAQAVAKGNHRVAEAIMNLDENLIQRLIDLDFES